MRRLGRTSKKGGSISRHTSLASLGAAASFLGFLPGFGLAGITHSLEAEGVVGKVGGGAVTVGDKYLGPIG